MRALVALCAALALAGCASTAKLSPAQDLESADTAAASAYAGVALLCNAYEAAKPTDAARAEALKVKAWGIFQQEQALYKQGQDVSALLSQLQTLQTQAKGL